MIGFRIHIDGVLRTVRDRKDVALEAAKLLKQKYRHSKIEIIDEQDQRTIEMLEDGRTA
jgi:predicted GIY-YIG superfamily endonuclease